LSLAEARYNEGGGKAEIDAEAYAAQVLQLWAACLDGADMRLFSLFTCDAFQQSLRFSFASFLWFTVMLTTFLRQPLPTAQVATTELKVVAAFSAYRDLKDDLERVHVYCSDNPTGEETSAVGVVAWEVNVSSGVLQAGPSTECCAC
jgi:hypothetical protein